MTPKNIIISAFVFILIGVGITKAMTPPPVVLTPTETKLLQLNDEINKNSAIYDQAQKNIDAAQSIIDLNAKIIEANKKTRDQAEADNIPKREAVINLTRTTRSPTGNSDGTAQPGTSGKTQPTE